MKSVFFILFSLLFFHVAAQVGGEKIEPNNEAGAVIDSIVNEVAGAFMKDGRQVGLSIGILKDGVTRTFHYGSTEKGKDLRPTDSSIYEIGSLSKTFTGTLLAQAIIEGKLDQGDDIRKYLPAAYPNLEYTGHPIKIIHLANHTSGLPLLLPEIPGFFQKPQDSIPVLISSLYRNYTRDNFWKDLHHIEIKNQPGYEVNYSNAGAQLAGFILERIYGLSYGSLIKKNITGPLGMSYTDVAYTKNTIQRLFAKGYNSRGIMMPYNHTLSILEPAGGICSSIKDMLAYLEMQLNEKNETVHLAHQVSYGDANTSATGLFWQINKMAGGQTILWHSGATFGFSCFCAICPDLNLGIILLSNEYDINSLERLTYLANNIINKGFKQEMKLPL
jgi:CubicO group peptidase (beta-lactamase class C family)